MLQLLRCIEKLCQRVKTHWVKDLPVLSYNSCMYTIQLNAENWVPRRLYKHCHLQISL